MTHEYQQGINFLLPPAYHSFISFLHEIGVHCPVDSDSVVVNLRRIEYLNSMDKSIV